MEIQLQELIDQIKKDGIEEANAQATQIIASAKEEGERIVASAQVQANLNYNSLRSHYSSLW